MIELKQISEFIFLTESNSSFNKFKSSKFKIVSKNKFKLFLLANSNKKVSLFLF